jgi:hypothetical protein
MDKEPHPSSADARVDQLERQLEALTAERKKSTRRRRWLLAATVSALALAPLGTAALGPLPHVFSVGDPIMASEINANFDHLQGAIDELEEPVGLCGTTAATDGSFSAPGGVVGLPAAAALCRTACGSPSAHMCTHAETQLLLQSAIRERGWFAGGSFHCSFWTHAAADTSLGNIMVPESEAVAPYAPLECSETAPILCCD